MPATKWSSAPHSLLLCSENLQLFVMTSTPLSVHSSLILQVAESISCCQCVLSGILRARQEGLL